MTCQCNVRCPKILERASWIGEIKVVNSRMNSKEQKLKTIAGSSTLGTVVSHRENFDKPM